MNRNNFWIHLCIAVVIIATAAVVGQIRRWRSSMPERPAPTRPDSRTKVPAKVNIDEATAPEVSVRFRQGLSDAEIKKLVATLNDRVDDRIESVGGLYQIDDMDGLDAEAVAEEYEKLGDKVLYAEPVMQISVAPVTSREIGAESFDELAPGLPNDPHFADQWSLQNTGQAGGTPGSDISAFDAWKITNGSEDIVVAVLDSGVEYTHSDLSTNIWVRPDNVPQYVDDQLGSVNDLNGFDAAANLKDPMDDNGHGTHCAGIIGAVGDNGEGIAGINWKVKIMPLKFLGRSGYGSTADAIEAINYAIDRKKNGVNIRIINASWGSTSNSRALQDVIKAAGEAGILFVAAAGNSSTDNDRWPHYPSNYDLPNVISVASVDPNDELSSFSNYGSKTVHIAAPGREIPSTWLGSAYREASGTSMAAPHVSGVAALILAQAPDLSVKELKERILKSVDKIDGLNGKVSSGGRLNAAKALGN